MTKRIIMALIATIIFASTAVAQSGFEFGITFPIGASINMPNDKIKSNLPDAVVKKLENGASKTATGFEWGATLQIGYMFAIGNGMSVSALFDIGYHRDVFAFSFKENIPHGAYNPITDSTPTKEVDVRNSKEFDTLQIGVLPKFRIKNMAIGLGGGVKILLGGINYSQGSSVEYDDAGVPTYNADKLENKEGYSLPLNVIQDSFKVPIIPYLKVTFDYMLAIDTKTSLTFGAYVGYDFNLEGKIGAGDNGSIWKGSDANYDKVGFSAIDLGIQIGLRFGPSAD